MLKINTEISNFSKIVCHPSVKVSYKLCYVPSHYPGFRIYVNIRSELVLSPRAYSVLPERRTAFVSRSVDEDELPLEPEI
jgi:hypothetical protein